MKAISRFIAVLIAASGVSSGASIMVSNMVDTNVVQYFAHIPVGSSFVAKIGTPVDGTVFSSMSGFAEINAAWINAGDITFASGDAAGQPGRFSGTVNFTDLLGLAGKDFHVWITDGGSFNAVIRSNTLDFLADSAEPNSNAYSISAATLAQSTLLVGYYDPSSGNPGGSIEFLAPEPTSVLLGALGFISFIARRRR